MERLIAQQLQELREYDKQFTIKYNKDLFIEPTFNLIEEVDPQHFLTENADAIGHLTSFTHDGHGTQDDNNITQDKLEGRKQEYLTTLTVINNKTAKKANVDCVSIEKAQTGF